MNIKNIIQASANIVRITELQKGNVVKYVDSETVYFAIVIDLLYDGEKSFVELLMVDSDYWSGVSLKRKLLTDTKDHAVFPVNPEEFKKHISEIEESVIKKIQEKRAELAKLESSWSFAKNVIDGKEVAYVLSTPKVELSMVEVASQ